MEHLEAKPEDNHVTDKPEDEAEQEKEALVKSGTDDQGVEAAEAAEVKHVSFDDVLKQLGEFGRYQRRVYFLLFLPTIFSAMHKLAWVFLGARVDYRCRLPGKFQLFNFR